MCCCRKRHTISRNAPHRERLGMYLGTRLAMQSMPGLWPWTEHVVETCCERSSFQNLWFPNGDEHRWIVVDLECQKVFHGVICCKCAGFHNAISVCPELYQGNSSDMCRDCWELQLAWHRKKQVKLHTKRGPFLLKPPGQHIFFQTSMP